jgi:hypothetical protein
MELTNKQPAVKQKRKNKPGAGRPFKPVNEQSIIECAKVLCTMAEISSICGLSVDTLEKNYAEVIKQAQEHGRESLRRMQYKTAMEGNVTMLIWLGKQWLGQRDKQPDEAQQIIYSVKINEVP